MIVRLKKVTWEIVGLSLILIVHREEGLIMEYSFELNLKLELRKYC